MELKRKNKRNQKKKKGIEGKVCEKDLHEYNNWQLAT